MDLYLFNQLLFMVGPLWTLNLLTIQRRQMMKCQQTLVIINIYLN